MSRMTLLSRAPSGLPASLSASLSVSLSASLLVSLLAGGALSALAGCAGATPDAEQQARETVKQETIEDILNQPLAAEDYGEEARCLSTHDYDQIDVLDDQHVVFRGSGDKLWINKLRHRCIGLRRNDVLRFRLHQSRVCDLDTFEAISSFMWDQTTGTCWLGRFTPVTPEQVEAIEVAVKEARRKR